MEFRRARCRELEINGPTGPGPWAMGLEAQFFFFLLAPIKFFWTPKVKFDLVDQPYHFDFNLWPVQPLLTFLFQFFSSVFFIPCSSLFIHLPLFFFWAEQETEGRVIVAGLGSWRQRRGRRLEEEAAPTAKEHRVLAGKTGLDRWMLRWWWRGAAAGLAAVRNTGWTAEHGYGHELGRSMVRVVSLRSAAAGKRGLGGELGFGGRGKEVKAGNRSRRWWRVCLDEVVRWCCSDRCWSCCKDRSKMVIGLWLRIERWNWFGDRFDWIRKQQDCGFMVGLWLIRWWMVVMGTVDMVNVMAGLNWVLENDWIAGDEVMNFTAEVKWWS